MDFTVKNNIITAYGTIENGDGIEFQNHFHKIDTRNRKIILKLHTQGGSVFDGNLIYNALVNSSAEVEIHIVGIAASMGAVISLACENVYMVENGYLMIHAPSGETFGTVADHESNIKLLSSIEANFIKKLVEKTGKDEINVKQWLIGDNWFDANQALNEGLITGIIEPETKTPRNFNPKKTSVKVAFSRYDAFMKKINNLNNDNMNLKQQLIKRFKLRSDASDTAIFMALESQEQETSQLRESLIELLGLKPEATEEDILQKITDLMELESGSQEEKTEQAKNLITDAIKKGKIAHGQRAYVTQMFANDFTATKKFLESTPERKTIISQIKSTAKNYKDKGVLPQSEWGIDEYRKFAPNELAADKELYQRLVDAKYKK